jgi:hypothetical protein
MSRKKGKSVSFDAMVKFFMQNYDIPTKKDVERLMAKLDQIEKLLKNSSPPVSRRRAAGEKRSGHQARRGTGSVAAEQVLEVFRGFKEGAGLAEIKEKTGFDDKKVRNIIFRLYKNGYIQRLSRGVYAVK